MIPTSDKAWVVYSPDYYITFKVIPNHVFPVEKYRLVYQQLTGEGTLDADEVVEPSPVTDEDVLLVHQPSYIERLRDMARQGLGFLTTDTPVTAEILRAVWLGTGGTILAGRLALQRGIGVNLCGGFHHAFAGHGEGFCYINDVAIAIRRLQREGLIERAAVIDCDLHHGNGTASIFYGDPTVFTFSIHEEDNYPLVKPPSDIDAGLNAGTDDETYLRHLRRHVPTILKNHRPHLVIYLAGADPYRHDQLGHLSLTIDGLKRRDEFVLTCARERDVPVCIVLAGGYAHDTRDVVEIHCNTVRTAKAMWRSDNMSLGGHHAAPQSSSSSVVCKFDDEDDCGRGETC
ncbi:MAG: histone deacetylase [Abditibacteriales bacterium]|nr:histone deacetylase [Abditibacteriales bacterium]MDW8365727.1 histone deacetylase [Abditibacteriales bacterium]